MHLSLTRAKQKYHFFLVTPNALLPQMATIGLLSFRSHGVVVVGSGVTIVGVGIGLAIVGAGGRVAVGIGLAIVEAAGGVLELATVGMGVVVGKQSKHPWIVAPFGTA